MSQHCQAVSGTQSPDGAQQNQGQEVQDVRQAGLLCLGERRNRDVMRRSGQRGLRRKVKEGKEKYRIRRKRGERLFLRKVTNNTWSILIVPIVLH